MILRSQDSEIYNLKLCYRIYCEKEKIYAQLESGERYSDYVIGKYKTSERAIKIFDEIFDSMKNDEKFFIMPKE